MVPKAAERRREMTNEQTGTSESTFYVTVEQLPLNLTNDHLRLVAEANKEKDGFHKTAYCMASELLTARETIAEVEENNRWKQDEIDRLTASNTALQARVDEARDVAKEIVSLSSNPKPPIDGIRYRLLVTADNMNNLRRIAEKG
jgi:hypothetical protein